MSTRTVRLDEEAESVLEEVVQTTGWSVSTTLKKGLFALREETARTIQRTPYDIYRELDLGPGGYAIAPASETRRGVREAIKKKLKR